MAAGSDVTSLRLRGTRSFARFAPPPRSTELPAPALNAYAPEDVTFAARAWTLKAEEEYRSAAVFSEVLAGLLELGAPLDLLSAIGRVVQDELGHARLCTSLARTLGAPEPTLELERVQARVATHPQRSQAAVSLLLFEGAIGETVSVALFHAGRRGAREPCTRAALSLILRDEARHARVCWEAAQEVLPLCPPEMRAALELDLTRALGAFERGLALPVLQRLEAGEAVAPALVELGVLPLELRVEQFYQSIERLALPRLTRLGFDGQKLWRDRYRV